jgi:hypothetical protein
MFVVIVAEYDINKSIPVPLDCLYTAYGYLPENISLLGNYDFPFVVIII